MARHWYPLAESGDELLHTAPFRYAHSVETTAPAERLWEVLTGEDLVRLVWVFTGLRWVSPRPFGVGTVRDVTLPGVFTARERFFRWEDAHRYTFGVFEASLPGLRHAAEDWSIESTPSGSRLTWTMAIEATPTRHAIVVGQQSGHQIRATPRHAHHPCPRRQLKSGANGPPRSVLSSVSGHTEIGTTTDVLSA